MRRRPIRRFSTAELEALPTRRLLALLKQLQQCENSAALSDSPPIAEGVMFKDSEEWVAAYEQLKQVLALREHIPRNR